MDYLTYLHIPYKHLGNSPQEGTDCYGLVKLVYEKEYNIKLPALQYEEHWFKYNPNYLLDQYEKYNFYKTEDTKEGTIIVFLEAKIPRHLGVILNDEYFIHTTLDGTAVHSYVSGKWASRVFCKLRYKG